MRKTDFFSGRMMAAAIALIAGSAMTATAVEPIELTGCSLLDGEVPAIIDYVTFDFNESVRLAPDARVLLQNDDVNGVGNTPGDPSSDLSWPGPLAYSRYARLYLDEQGKVTANFEGYEVWDDYTYSISFEPGMLVATEDESVTNDYMGFTFRRRPQKPQGLTEKIFVDGTAWFTDEYGTQSPESEIHEYTTYLTGNVNAAGYNNCRELRTQTTGSMSDTRTIAVVRVDGDRVYFLPNHKSSEWELLYDFSLGTGGSCEVSSPGSNFYGDKDEVNRYTAVCVGVKPIEGYPQTETMVMAFYTGEDRTTPVGTMEWIRGVGSTRGVQYNADVLDGLMSKLTLVKPGQPADPQKVECTFNSLQGGQVIPDEAGEVTFFFNRPFTLAAGARAYIANTMVNTNGDDGYSRYADLVPVDGENAARADFGDFRIETGMEYMLAIEPGSLTSTDDPSLEFEGYTFLFRRLSSGVFEIEAAGTLPEGYFDLNGRCVAHPEKGNIYVTKGKKIRF